MKLTPSMLRLYAVTDRSWSADEADFWRRVSEAMEGGAQVVQLREKHLSHEEMLRAAEAARSQFLLGYVRLSIDSANLRSAVRSARMGKGADFLRRALLDLDLSSGRRI